MKVKRIVFINRAPFGDLDLDFSGKRVISLTGINGSGKTTLLSYIVDAFYEMTRKAFSNEFSGNREGKLYRISSNLYTVLDKKYSLVYILFDVDGKDAHYIDLLGSINESSFTEMMSSVWNGMNMDEWPIKYNDIKNQVQQGEQCAKYIKIERSEVLNAFSHNLLTYFPSYRYEQPGYLNDIFRMELSCRNTSVLSGYLMNPIEVTSDLPEIANWMMDVVLDSNLYGDVNLLNGIQTVISAILVNKHKVPVRIGIGQRNLGGARIQIVDAQSRKTVYPSIFNISAGEAALLCVFGELMRQADNLGSEPDRIGGIVLIDEVDKHLHVVLQKEVVPQLIQLFPNLQFIISTHSTFVNMGLMDIVKSECSIIDLDNKSIECDVSSNIVFSEAYESMIAANERYAYFNTELKKRLKDITKPIAFLGGRTDEKYFRKAIEVFGYSDERVVFKWIGNINSRGNESFTGDSSLNHGINFVKGIKSNIPYFFIFDCDTNKPEFDESNIIVITIPENVRNQVMNKGIENALELDGIDLECFYEERTEYKDYGNKATFKELDKMKMCDFICDLDIETQKRVLANLKPIIEKVFERLDENTVEENGVCV